MEFFYIIDILLFIVFFINVIYLLIFSLASVSRKANVVSVSEDRYKRVAILIPAYKEDAVIQECVESCLVQKYPADCFDTIVISDRMSARTNKMLADEGARVIEVFFENSTKSKALNYAMSILDEDYDIALILDADNTIAPEFLSQINNEFWIDGTQIVQAHRCAKNLNTNLALLDAVSEEINNSIFRQGHVNLGFSAALIGSGMAFDYVLFKTTMLSINAIGGFDRALELTLLRDRHRIYYLSDAYVLDEKVQCHVDFSRQRRRWLSAQWHYMCQNICEIPNAVRDKNWDFCSKIFQQMSFPRLLLIGFGICIAVALSFVDLGMAIKWWVLLALLFAAVFIAVPRRMYTRQLAVAMFQLPYSFLLMALNMFKLKGANKKFIHTSHGVKES